jgi:hypothetical protein
MRRISFILIILLPILFVISCSKSNNNVNMNSSHHVGDYFFNPGTEPNGFKNINWGTNIKNINGFDFKLLRSKQLKDSTHIDIYTSNKEKFSIYQEDKEFRNGEETSRKYGVDFSTIEYDFIQGSLFRIAASTSAGQFDLLLNILKELYGNEPKEKLSKHMREFKDNFQRTFGESHSWAGEKTVVIIWKMVMSEMDNISHDYYSGTKMVIWSAEYFNKDNFPNYIEKDAWRIETKIKGF